VRLVLVIPPSESVPQEQRISLREEGLDIGGAADCDAVVDDPSVGTARVRLERRGQDWIVLDREGRGSCSVGGVPLRAREPRVVRPPHTIRLGGVELQLVLDPADSHGGATREVALRAAAFVAEVAPVRPRVRVVEGPHMGEILELAHGTTYRVGRGKSCDLFLESDDASREHFAIEQVPGRVIVRDLGSARGTFLGRSRLEPQRGAVWEPSRMLRAADAVLSLEVATSNAQERLLEPLAHLQDDVAVALSPPPPEAAVSDDSSLSAPDEVKPEVPSEPNAQAARDPSFVIAIIAAAIGIAAVGVLVALIVW
jgi:hypothetical protein